MILTTSLCGSMMSASPSQSCEYCTILVGFVDHTNRQNTEALILMILTSDLRRKTSHHSKRKTKEF